MHLGAECMIHHLGIQFYLVDSWGLSSYVPLFSTFFFLIFDRDLTKLWSCVVFHIIRHLICLELPCPSQKSLLSFLPFVFPFLALGLKINWSFTTYIGVCIMCTLVFVYLSTTSTFENSHTDMWPTLHGHVCSSLEHTCETWNFLFNKRDTRMCGLSYMTVYHYLYFFSYGFLHFLTIILTIQT